MHLKAIVGGVLLTTVLGCGSRSPGATSVDTLPRGPLSARPALAHVNVRTLAAVACQVRMLQPLPGQNPRWLDVAPWGSSVVVAIAPGPELNGVGVGTVFIVGPGGETLDRYAGPPTANTPVLAVSGDELDVFWSTRAGLVRMQLSSAHSGMSFRTFEVKPDALAGVVASDRGLLVVGGTADAGMEGYLGGIATLLRADAIIGTWRSPPLRGAFIDVVERSGGWLALQHGVSAPEPRSESMLIQLDARLEPVASRRLADDALAYCSRALVAGRTTYVVCPTRVIRFDPSFDVAAVRPLDVPPIGAALASGELVLLHPETREWGPLSNPRICLSFLGHAPSDCFEPIGYDRGGDQMQVSTAFSANGDRLVVAYAGGRGAERSIFVRVYQCSLDAAPLSWIDQPLVAGGWTAVRANPNRRQDSPPQARYVTPVTPPSRTPECEPNDHPPALMPFEVTVNEYRRCVAERHCTGPRGQQHAALPIVGVTKEQAASYCAFVKSRLPTDGEWLAAAQAGCSGFPWGESPVVGASNCILSEGGYALMRPKSRPRDVVRSVYDLHGNALEWTADGTVRGARFCSERLDAPQVAPAEGFSNHLGFRCMQPQNPPMPQ